MWKQQVVNRKQDTKQGNKERQKKKIQYQNKNKLQNNHMKQKQPTITKKHNYKMQNENK